MIGENVSGPLRGPSSVRLFSPGHTRSSTCAPWGYLKSRPLALRWSSTNPPDAVLPCVALSQPV